MQNSSVQFRTTLPISKLVHQTRSALRWSALHLCILTEACNVPAGAAAAVINVIDKPVVLWVGDIKWLGNICKVWVSAVTLVPDLSLNHTAAEERRDAENTVTIVQSVQTRWGCWSVEGRGEGKRRKTDEGSEKEPSETRGGKKGGVI